MLYSINWPNCWLSDCLCIVIVCYPVSEVIIFENYLSIFYQAVFLHNQKSAAKIEKQKELLRWNKKHFSLFLKEFQLLEIVSGLKLRL